MKKNLSLYLGLAAGLLTLLPPWLIGTGQSALALQSLKHWMFGSNLQIAAGVPDTFESLHIHWLWLPRTIAFATGNAFAALMIFRGVIFGITICLFTKVTERIGRGNLATTLFGVAMLALNVTVLFLLHSFGTQLLTLFVAVWMLYLLTSEKSNNHRLAALVFGLSLSIGFFPFVLLLAIVTVGLNLHHETYTMRSKETLLLVAYAIAGAASYLLLELYLFGSSHLVQVLLPKAYQPREISLIAQGILIGLCSINLLVMYWGRGAGLAKDFRPALFITTVFFLVNVFSREEMLQSVMVLLPCLVLIVVDRSEDGRSGRVFPIAYLAFNLALFFLLPLFLPDAQIAMPAGRRITSSSDVSLHYYASADLFSFAKLREEAAGEHEIRQLLSQQRLDSTVVIVTPGTDYWFDAGTLGAMYPTTKFGWFYGNPIAMVRMNGIDDTTFIRPLPERPYLAAIFEKQFARTFVDSALPPSVAIRESERFQFIDTRGNADARRMLIDQLIALEYRSFHH